MIKNLGRWWRDAVGVTALGVLSLATLSMGQDRGTPAASASHDLVAPDGGGIGRELSIPVHLQDEDEFSISLQALLAHGEKLFSANWTIQEGQGRPLTKG